MIPLTTASIMTTVSKESTCNAGDLGLILEPGRSSGEGSGNPLQYSCLGNLMDQGTWQATVHRALNKSLFWALRYIAV